VLVAASEDVEVRLHPCTL